MKKLIALILAALLIPSASFAVPPVEQRIEIRDIVQILSYENLLKLADMVDEYLVEKSGKTAFEIKLDAMSAADLLALNHQIQLKLFSQQLVDGVTVPAGTYIIGEDIPSGTYRIGYKGLYEYDFCSFMAINADDENFLSYTTILGYSGSPEIGKITLPEGTELTIQNGSVIFYAYSGLFN